MAMASAKNGMKNGVSGGEKRQSRSENNGGGGKAWHKAAAKIKSEKSESGEK